MAQDDSKYTKPALRKRIFNQVKAGSKGGNLVSGLLEKHKWLHKNIKLKEEVIREEKVKNRKDLKRWGKEKWMTKKEYEKKKKD